MAISVQKIWVTNHQTGSLGLPAKQFHNLIGILKTHGLLNVFSQFWSTDAEEKFEKI